MDIRLKWFYRLGFLLLLLIVIFVFLKLQALWMPVLNILLSVIIPFIIAAFITYLLHPVVEKLHETGLHRGIAVFIIYFLFFGGAGFSLYKGIPAIIHQLRDLAENAPQFANQYRGWIDVIQEKTSTWPDGIQTRIDDGIFAVEGALDSLLSRVINSLLNILNYAVIIAVIPFISFYLLKDFTIMKKAVWYLTPRSWRKEGVLFLRDIDKSLGSYIRGQLLVCAAIGTISSLLFWVFGMRYPLLLGLIIGVTNIIPYFGPIIGAVPAVIIATTLSVKMIVITVGIIIVLQFLEGNILSPLIVGKSLHMHPLLIMLALLAGGEAGGILGLIIAVPILAVLKVSLIHARKHFSKRPEPNITGS
ncbi:putative PurR-regulated permease PerM [Cytobacillus oceanisediminis]|uniref:Putative PurR-regulated permease PerM n=1 Tax=Cytobacillus oceanisediminis TaxID=665099 RepID=A0A2V2ZVG9_9BACI|nr:AI-2E family transporter [Cytobacillus oceanisediminis]PWW26473.1 putative PurR-regulated permease PerM [Cytobacillus oceanisediminis]